MKSEVNKINYKYVDDILENMGFTRIDGKDIIACNIYMAVNGNDVIAYNGNWDKPFVIYYDCAGKVNVLKALFECKEYVAGSEAIFNNITRTEYDDTFLIDFANLFVVKEES